ncbi:MAG: hypothetical protein HeimC3_04570 [Candidatus Heimdallarchaeota archaeon LC_3]|nr:MAG: hypothetical protein HeimC3_04570 [Candidatus Heimdallarchaeota archaeon LC_3]
MKKKNPRTELRTLTTLSSQMKQGLLEQVQEDVRSLAKKKKEGFKVGKLKYKKIVKTIPLKQYNITYKIQQPNYIRIQGLRQWLKVRGLKQIPKNAEFANAKLIQKQNDYYLHVTVYLPKRKRKHDNDTRKQSIGIDSGIANQLTLSNGIQIKYNLQIRKQLRRTYRKLSRKKTGSKNYLKTLVTLRKLFNHWNNRKHDVINKIVHILTTHYKIICYQKDNIKNWQRLFGTKLLNTALGELFVTLNKRATTSGVVDQWEPTTKRCALCQTVLPEPIPLSDRTFVCLNCDWTSDRDWNAALVIEVLGLQELDLDLYSTHFLDFDLELPTERRNVKPLETKTSQMILNGLFQQIPFVSSEVLSMNEEAHSLRCG